MKIPRVLVSVTLLVAAAISPLRADEAASDDETLASAEAGLLPAPGVDLLAVPGFDPEPFELLGEAIPPGSYRQLSTCPTGAT